MISKPTHGWHVCSVSGVLMFEYSPVMVSPSENEFKHFFLFPVDRVLERSLVPNEGNDDGCNLQSLSARSIDLKFPTAPFT